MDFINKIKDTDFRQPKSSQTIFYYNSTEIDELKNPQLSIQINGVNLDFQIFPHTNFSKSKIRALLSSIITQINKIKLLSSLYYGGAGIHRSIYDQTYLSPYFVKIGQDTIQRALKGKHSIFWKYGFKRKQNQVRAMRGQMSAVNPEIDISMGLKMFSMILSNEETSKQILDYFIKKNLPSFKNKCENKTLQQCLSGLNTKEKVLFFKTLVEDLNRPVNNSELNIYNDFKKMLKNILKEQEYMSFDKVSNGGYLKKKQRKSKTKRSIKGKNKKGTGSRKRMRLKSKSKNASKSRRV
jgi:hypothetical protein